MFFISAFCSNVVLLVSLDIVVLFFNVGGQKCFNFDTCPENVDPTIFSSSSKASSHVYILYSISSTGIYNCGIILTGLHSILFIMHIVVKYLASDNVSIKVRSCYICYVDVNAYSFRMVLQ